jgi:glycosyltransferase involved in cell wall biosynthesis
MPESNGASPIRILYLVDQLRPSGGGAERSLQRIVRLLPPSRFECSVATFYIEDRAEVERLIPCPLHVIPFKKSYGIDGLRAAVKLAQIIRSQKIQIVQTFFPTSDLWGGIVAKMSGCPILISSRRDLGVTRTFKHGIAYRLMNPLFNQVHAVSEQVRRYTIKQDHLSESKVVTIPNGVDFQHVLAASPAVSLRKRLGIAADTPVVVTVGHLRRVKGIENILQAAAEVRKRVPEVVFLVLGDAVESEYFTELLQMKKDLALDTTVRFVHGVSDVLPVLKVADIFCLLSWTEGCSNALLEAMACGLPSVVSNVGGNPEAIQDGINGYLVPLGDWWSAADRITLLLQSRSDARRMGDRAKETVQRTFTAETMVAHMCRLYNGLLQPAGSY